MEWIVRASNEQNHERSRKETIARHAPTLWQNVCQAIERAVQMFRSVNNGMPVEFSGCANHTVWVATFAQDEIRPHGPERERMTITFNQESNVIEARSSGHDAVRVFPMTLNVGGQLVLMDGNDEISTERFTELVLKKLLFPT